MNQNSSTLSNASNQHQAEDLGYKTEVGHSVHEQPLSASPINTSIPGLEMKAVLLALFIFERTMGAIERILKVVQEKDKK